MNGLDRREFLKTTSWLLASAGLPLSLRARTVPGEAPGPAYEWIRRARMVIAEGFDAPFYPEYQYDPERAVGIIRDLGGDSIRYPAAGYYAFFPTRSGFPVHPELRGDPLARTVELCRKRGMKTVVYMPFNHAFMNVHSKDPRYADWTMRFADGTPMITGHMGNGRFYEGCLNSPLREVIKRLFHEVVADYPIDAVYFDGPYQGMAHSLEFCHCRYCEAAYRSKFGKPVPIQGPDLPLADVIQYTDWMTNDVALAMLHEVRESIRRTRDIPVLFNDTALLGMRQWRSHGIKYTDGFMFESAYTPEDKLFNLDLGRSTGKVIWTYVGGYDSYNRAHLEDRYIMGWYSYPTESRELLMDGAAAMAGHAGLLYWGLNRFFYVPNGPLAYPSGRYVREVFDFQVENERVFRGAEPRPQVGILVGSQTIDWYRDPKFIARAYPDGFHGAFKVLKANSHEPQPFLDWEMTAERLARYPVVFAPDAVCLSDAQCGLLDAYVRGGGRLIATHQTSAADEYGRPRSDFGLSRLFGVSWVEAEPIEQPDLYLHFPSGEEIPQDPQILRIRADGAEVLADTVHHGHRGNLGPALTRRTAGRGEVIYIGSRLEAIYAETLMEPIRTFFGRLLGPWLDARRSYEVDFRLGVTPQFESSDDTLILHLLVDIGDKYKQTPVRESYTPIADLKARIRIPAGRSVRLVRLLRARQDIPAAVRGGWVEVTIPSVSIYEAIEVELG
ncbi:MAG: beta-galactosidase trimerization domain-containing protein [Opitutaceae bacterium]